MQNIDSETCFGYKVHVLVTPEGLHDLVDEFSNVTISADKGYTGNYRHGAALEEICFNIIV